MPVQPRPLSPLQREVALYSQGLLGEEAGILTYGDDDGKLQLPVLVANDVPNPGVTTYATIGLSDHPQPNYGSSLRLELIGACDAGFPDFGNVISSCVFECLKNDRPINYGVVFYDIVKQYRLSRTMDHVTFVAPSAWEGFTRTQLLKQELHWLMVVPISESEMAHLKTNGIDALEERLQSAQVDITDLNRPAVV
jgi:antitoxin YqcF